MGPWSSGRRRGRLALSSPSINRMPGTCSTGTQKYCFEHAYQTLSPAGSPPDARAVSAEDERKEPAVDVVYDRCAGNRHQQGGREGVYPGSRRGEGHPASRRGPYVLCLDLRVTGDAGLVAGPAHHGGGNGGDRVVLEARVLPAGTRHGVLAAQRPPHQGGPRPQDGCEGRRVDRQAGRTRPGAALVRAAGADPAAAGPDPVSHRCGARTRPRGPAAAEPAGRLRDQAVVPQVRVPCMSRIAKTSLPVTTARDSRASTVRQVQPGGRAVCKHV